MFLKPQTWDLPGDPVAKTLCFQGKESRFDPSSGKWIPCVAMKSSHAAVKDSERHSEGTRSRMLQLRPGATK